MSKSSSVLDIRNGEFLAELERRADGEPVGSGGGDKARSDHCREFSLRKVILAQMWDLTSMSDASAKSRELERRAGMPALANAGADRRVRKASSPPARQPAGLARTPSPPLAGDMFIDRLRAAMAARRLGARVLIRWPGRHNVDVSCGSSNPRRHIG